MKLRREQKEYIEFELRHYEQTKREWEELQDQIVNGSDYTISDMPRGSDVVRPTEKKAMRLVSSPRLTQLERNVKAIERIVMELPEEKYNLVVLKYWTYPRRLTDEGIAAELSIDRATLYRWADKILLGIAVELGIVDINCDKVATMGGY